MPKVANKLNDKQIKSIAAHKPAGLYMVGGVSGLSLQVRINPITGARTASWILRVCVHGKRHSFGLGGYNGSLLSKIRDKAEQIKYEIKYLGLDPLQNRADAKQAALEGKAVESNYKTFKDFAEIYIQKKEKLYNSHKQSQKLISQFENFVYDHIGDLLIKDINISHIVKLLEIIWHDKYETANRTRIHIAGVFSMAIAGDLYTKLNPARWKGGIEEFLDKPSKKNRVVNRPAVSVDEMPKLYNLITNNNSQSSKALTLIMLTASRYSEVVKAKWSEIDLENKMWTKPPEHTKSKDEHTVPLSLQAIQLLKSLPRDSELIFPSTTNRPLSDVAITKAHRKYGFKDKDNLITTHGFRSTFKEWARNLTNYPDELSEIQLHHAVGDETYQAYARGDLLEKRRHIVQDWADYCKHGKQVGGDNVRAIGA